MAAFDSIPVPDNLFGIKPIQRSGTNADGTPKTRAAFDGAHAVGADLWERKMDAYQTLLGPSGTRGFNSDMRTNGTLVASRTVDAAIMGTTAHGKHVGEVDELFWSSDPDAPSFMQTVEDKLEKDLVRLGKARDKGDISQSTYDTKAAELRNTAIKEHIVFTKWSEAQYIRQDILDKSGYADLNHIAINKSDPAFFDSNDPDGSLEKVKAHNKAIKESFNYENAKKNPLFIEFEKLIKVSDIAGINSKADFDDFGPPAAGETRVIH